MKNIINKIFDSRLFHKRFDGLRWYGNILHNLSKRMDRKYIDVWLRVYSCDVDKNIECNKKNCAICHFDKYGCTNTTQYRYAKKTPLNFVKKIINKTRGVYKYE